jgi:hypothetical protein
VQKVFLCHSSQDKHYVRRIAKRLGRSHVIFDEVSFDPGQDFRQQVIKGLNRSSLFVFIASKASLKSTWCLFEIDDAQQKSIDGTIEGQLTIIPASHSAKCKRKRVRNVSVYILTQMKFLAERPTKKFHKLLAELIR